MYCISADKELDMQVLTTFWQNMSADVGHTDNSQSWNKCVCGVFLAELPRSCGVRMGEVAIVCPKEGCWTAELLFVFPPLEWVTKRFTNLEDPDV